MIRPPAGHAAKIERILARLGQATVVGDMDLPGYRLHPLKGWLGSGRFRFLEIGG